jgi:hypothetical protein
MIVYTFIMENSTSPIFENVVGVPRFVDDDRGPGEIRSAW